MKLSLHVTVLKTNDFVFMLCKIPVSSVRDLSDNASA